MVFSRDVFLRPEKRGVGMVFQSYALWLHMTVFDNVAYPRKIRKQETRSKVSHALSLAGSENRYPSQLSCRPAWRQIPPSMKNFI
ncbi:MAG: hypothetical protein QXQ48_05970 [Nitrososphaerota archaeon]